MSVKTLYLCCPKAQLEGRLSDINTEQSYVWSALDYDFNLDTSVALQQLAYFIKECGVRRICFVFSETLNSAEEAKDLLRKLVYEWSENQSITEKLAQDQLVIEGRYFRKLNDEAEYIKLVPEVK